MSERWPYIPVTMAIQPILRIPLNHKRLSRFLALSKPQADYNTGGWIDSILAALLICKFPVLDRRLSSQMPTHRLPDSNAKKCQDIGYPVDGK